MSFFNSNSSVQDYISAVYLYLLILGIANETIFYSFIGIDYLAYATISDILLSPINNLTRDWKLIVIVITLLVLLVWSLKLGQKRHLRKSEDRHYRESKSFKSNEQLFGKEKIKGTILVMPMLMAFGFFVGMGIGKGERNQERLQNIDEMEFKQLLILKDQKPLKVNVLGQTSEYLFYVPINNKRLTVSPIHEAVIALQEEKLEESEEQDAGDKTLCG